ncbi:EAL domain-containing protein [Calditerrivibrio sp.]|uniref:EAL domain-containing protein n=1 Tax=Calditerrivibrio sp. TaxID=2792612 RepID=UPI003D0E26AB
MSCEKCTTTKTLPEDCKRIVIFASHEYILGKFFTIFKSRFEILNENDYLVLNYKFNEFIEIVSSSKDFTEIELENITVLLIDPTSSLTFGAYKNAKPLTYWINLYLSKDLKWILDNESIITYFQPIIDIRSNQIVGYECLSRGIKMDGSIMPPNLMFHSARKTEMIFNLDRQCRISAIKNSKAKEIDKMIFINFTPTSIYNPEFCLRDTVKTATELNFDFSKIVFEVVESDKVENFVHLKNILDFYNNMGFKVALDDVGSGYSSLNLLASLKPNIVKIDIELVRDIDKDIAKKAIVSSLVGICKEIGSLSLAEGIETHGEMEMLKNLGVDLMQGYLFGKPSPEPLDKIIFC